MYICIYMYIYICKTQNNWNKNFSLTFLKVVTNEKGEALGEVLTIIC